VSVVTGVVLICSSWDGDEEDEHGNDVPTPTINALNVWLSERGFGELKSVEKGAGGNKHPQLCIYAAGYNHFGSYEDEFAQVVITADWKEPLNVILVMQPEEGATRVFAPYKRQWCDFLEDVCPVCDTHLLTPSS
jgi:hypothetical protein